MYSCQVWSLVLNKAENGAIMLHPGTLKGQSRNIANT